MKQALLVLLLATTACLYDPNFPEGIQCSPEGECPMGQVCALDGRCYDEGTVVEPNEDARLETLTVSRGELVPAFDPAVTSYRLALPLGAKDLVVTPTAAEPDGAIIEVAGSQVESGEPSSAVSLGLGETVVEITVTPAAGDALTYQIDASRGAGILQQAYLKASNTDPDDTFGGTLALDGDTLAVGAFGEDSNATGVGGDQSDNSLVFPGAVYVFARTNGVWEQQAYLKASNTGSGDAFGVSVALSGDTLAVGAHSERSDATGIDGDQTNDNAGNAGAVYIFVRNGTTWSQQAYVKASNTEAGDTFGDSVALDGDTLAVGASGEDSGATGVNGNQADDGALNSGAVYVFTRSGSQWSQQAYIKASNTEAGDQFGASVALSGNSLAVGAEFEASSSTGINGDQGDNGAEKAGAAYVFARSGSQWSQQAYIKASNTGAGDRFGFPLALDGDTLVVAAVGESSGATGSGGVQDDDGAPEAGAVYIFERSGTQWSQTAYLKASNTDAGDHFGIGVDLQGDVLIVGAGDEASTATGLNGNQDNNDAEFAGAAFLFTRRGAEWSQQAYIKASNTGAADQFGGFAGSGHLDGHGVAISGDTVAVGAPSESSGAVGVNGSAAEQNDNTADAAGAAYIFQ